MVVASKPSSSVRDFTIWLFAFGYFACYAPYSALTKALSKGLLPSMGHHSLSGFAVLPVSVAASAIGMLVFISAMRWWKHATHGVVFGRSVPRPTRWTFLSGLATSAVVATTTLAYTFDGVSSVFVMLLMRGGVLILAPIVDSISKRSVRWFSWAGLALSLLALLVAFSEEALSGNSDAYDITLICAIDVGIYLAAYFVRLRFMSRLAKSEQSNANLRFFVEEQMVATPSLLLALAIGALVGQGEILAEVRRGFAEAASSPVLAELILVGILSQGTGIFGGLILLDRRENTYCVPVNRCSSVLAGVIASYLLVALFSERTPSPYELVGASLILVAILALTIPPMMEKARRRAAPVAEAMPAVQTRRTG